jgi:zinc D-Ala-D-Ala dipeptidase
MTHGDAARRAFWTRRMEDAHAFMAAAYNHPIEDGLEPAGRIDDAAAAAAVRMSFSSAPHAAGVPRRFWLRRSLLRPLVAAGRELNERGWILHIEDGYRSPTMQRALAGDERIFDGVLRAVLWECEGVLPTWDFVYRRMSVLTATTPKTGTHIAASAIDVSVIDDSGEEVDRGGPYIELSELTPMDSPFIGPEAAANRRAITEILGRHGFVAYPFEFWHYSAGDVYEGVVAGGGPARYGPVELNYETGAVAPLGDVTAQLFDEDEMRTMIDASLERLRQEVV